MEVATPATNAAVAAAAAAREVAAVAALAAVEATRSPQSQQQHCFFIKVAKSSATQKEVENKKSRERPKNETSGEKKTEAPLFHFLGGFGTVDVVGHVITRSDAGLGTNRFGFGNLDGTGGGGRKRRRRGSSNFNLERYFLF